MGNSHDKTFNTRKWQTDTRFNNYEIVRDPATGIQAERHIIENNPHIS